MKKLLLFLMAASVSAGAYAQAGAKSIVFSGNMEYKTPVNTVKAKNVPGIPDYLKSAHISGVGHKTTLGPAARYYNYFDYIDLIRLNLFTSSTTNQTSLLNMWFDSSILQRFNTGYGQVNYLSAAAVIDPVALEFNADTDMINSYYNQASGASDLMAVTDTNTYKVDSIYITGTYINEKPSRTTPDSLIISVVPSGSYYYWTSTTGPWKSNYTTDDTIRGYAPINVDSVRRSAVSNVAGSPGQQWTIPLTSAMSDTPDASGSVHLRTFAFAPPSGPITIPAGHTVAISVTFKSTDHWIPNVDSINEYDRFMPLFGYEGAYPTGAYMTYWRNPNNGQQRYFNDRNMSSLMFSSDTTFYGPVLGIQGTNLPAALFYGYEYADMGMLIECATCGTIGTTPLPNPTSVHNVTSVIGSADAYPNPANTEVNIPFELKHDANVTVQLTNALGQIVATQSFTNTKTGKAVFTTSTLANGIYFYTINASGNRMTGRLVVAH